MGYRSADQRLCLWNRDAPVPSTGTWRVDERIAGDGALALFDGGVLRGRDAARGDGGRGGSGGGVAGTTVGVVGLIANLGSVMGHPADSGDGAFRLLVV